MFSMKILSILRKFHEKTFSRPGDIKIFRLGRRMYMYIPSPFLDAMLSEERQLMKWVGIFQVGILPGGIFLEPWYIKFFFRNTRPEVFCEKHISKYYAKITGIAYVGVAFLIKLTMWLFIFTFGFISYSFLWNRLQVFFKVAVLQNFTKVIWKYL